MLPGAQPRKAETFPSIGRPTHLLFRLALRKAWGPREVLSLAPSNPEAPSEVQRNPGNSILSASPRLGPLYLPQLRSDPEARPFPTAGSAAHRFGLVWGGDGERQQVVRRAGTRTHL